MFSVCAMSYSVFEVKNNKKGGIMPPFAFK